MNTAILFPGQGAQAVGMGRALAESAPEARALLDRANEVLGYDLAAICFDGPQEELTRSDRAQPAIFVVSIMAWERLKAEVPSLNPVAFAGLSSGEWAALHAAGVVSYDDALRVLEARGRLMQEACSARSGSMISVIGLDREKLEQVCTQTGLQIANLNSPDQTVLSGTVEGVEAAEPLAVELGARRAIRLNVAGAFHSRLMQPAADKFAAFLEGIELQAPSVPVLSNVTGAPHEDPAGIRQAMVDQVIQSVRWVDNARWMLDHGADHFVECGPGRVLSGLMKRIDKAPTLHNIGDASSLSATVTAVG